MLNTQYGFISSGIREIIFAGSATFQVSKCELGFIVLRYDKPDSYDYIFRNILNSISNNLEFLRMKNDIKYLLHCQNIAENRDTLTNMLNERGFRSAFQSAEKNDNICFVGLRVCLFNEKYSATNHNIKIKSITDIAECIHQFCGTSGICAKADNNTFFCLILHLRKYFLNVLNLFSVSTRNICNITEWVHLSAVHSGVRK